MKWINTITDSPNQSMVLKTPNGAQISFTLTYITSNEGWYYSLTYGSFSLKNRRIVVGVNMLRAFRNILPFGFACTTLDGYEPIYLEDFVNGRANFYLLDSVNGRANFYLLDSTDIQTVETILA